MLDVRQRLVLGSAMLLGCLVALGGSSLVMLERYSRTLDRTFRENYDSIIFAQKMKDAVSTMDDEAQHSLWSGHFSWDKGGGHDAALWFEDNLRREQGNVTVAREGEMVERLTTAWVDYRTALAETTTLNLPPADLVADYRQRVTPRVKVLKDTAQGIIDVNMGNIALVNGTIKENIEKAKNLVYALLVGGIAITVLITVVTVRGILHPLKLFTSSAREIARGNLDLNVSVRAKGELGELAQAFNTMAARLREFRKSDRAKLFRTQRTTQMAMDSFPDAVAVIGPDGKVELANQSARVRFGLEPHVDLANLSPRSLWELFHEAQTSGKPTSARGYERTIQIFERGVEHFYRPQAVPILGEDNALAGVTLVLSDVTDLHRLDEMKSDLLSVVSHELKTPLTSVRMATHLLLDEKVGPLTGKQTELLVAAREDTERLHAIIENLLDLGRLEAGKSLLEPQPVSTANLLASAAEPFQAPFKDHGLQLRVDVEPGTPDVLVDKARIQHVFSNLLGNCLKYTPSGGTVTLGAHPEGKHVRVVIADTGIGIPPEYQARVFERFFRIPGAPGATGAGLGLAIAREIIDAHGGELRLDKSRPGEGTVFSFTLRTVERDAMPIKEASA